MAKEVIAIAQTAEEAEFIQRLLATGGVLSSLHRSREVEHAATRGDIHFINFGEILVDVREMAQARAILGEYGERLDKMRGDGK